VGDWQIAVNNSKPYTLPDFGPTDAHVRGSLGLDITHNIVQGQNIICVIVRTAQPDGGLLNPLYLAGEFGVMLNPDRLVPQKSEGRFECYEENFLPYYAGVIEYVSEFTLQCLPETDAALVEFVYAEPFHDAVEVSINGGDYAPILWQPRRLKLATQQLHVGENRLTTRVYTTLIRSFEGQCFDYHRHVYRDIENTARDMTS
jgi:hypothetical protein